MEEESVEGGEGREEMRGEGMEKGSLSFALGSKK